jgi:hypothetical protein
MAASISVVGGWWVVKANKKGNRRRNGNFNFTVVGHVMNSIQGEILTSEVCVSVKRSGDLANGRRDV